MSQNGILLVHKFHISPGKQAIGGQISELGSYQIFNPTVPLIIAQHIVLMAIFATCSQIKNCHF